MFKSIRWLSVRRFNVGVQLRCFSDSTRDVVPRQMSGPQRYMIESLEQIERDPRYVLRVDSNVIMAMSVVGQRNRGRWLIGFCMHL